MDLSGSLQLHPRLSEILSHSMTRIRAPLVATLFKQNQRFGRNQNHNSTQKVYPFRTHYRYHFFLFNIYYYPSVNESNIGADPEEFRQGRKEPLLSSHWFHPRYKREQFQRISLRLRPEGSTTLVQYRSHLRAVSKSFSSNWKQLIANIVEAFRPFFLSFFLSIHSIIHRVQSPRQIESFH